MTPDIAKIVWGLGCVVWYLIRIPYERRARKVPVVRRADRAREMTLMTISLCGLFVVPVIYASTDQPDFANYPFRPLQAWIGVLVDAAALVLFFVTHRDLGRAFSITLEVREGHALVSSGIYRRLRHPMYTSIWLWALAQALLLPNWIAGPAGLVGFGVLFFGRIGREEELMLARFGDDYRAYMARTWRIVPGLY